MLISKTFWLLEMITEELRVLGVHFQWEKWPTGVQVKSTSHTTCKSRCHCWGISKAVPGNKVVSAVTVACSLGPEAPGAPVEGVTRKGCSTAAGHMSVLHTGALHAISFVIDKGGSVALETETIALPISTSPVQCRVLLWSRPKLCWGRFMPVNVLLETWSRSAELM